MNLHTTLKAYNEASPITKEQQLILDEAQAIINNAEKNDLSILDKLGMNENLKEYQKITTENEQASKFEEIYDVSVIRKMAIHYGLRFLPSDMYKGTIDPLLPSILNRFCDKHNITIEEVKKEWDYDWRGRMKHVGNNKQFFILAPAESFELEERPKDPIIFYKINDSKYALIHKWGNDLNNGRLLSNLFCRSTGHICLTYSVIVIIATLLTVHVTGEPGLYGLLSALVVNIMLSMEAEGNAGKWDSKYL